MTGIMTGISPGAQDTPMEEKNTKPRRSDRGPRITKRDFDTLAWIAQQYAICLDHLSVLLARLMDYSDYARKPDDPGELGQKRTTKIVRRWQELGLIERGWILHDDPMWVWLTPEGLRLVRDNVGELLRPYTPTPAKMNHLYWCNHARLHIEQSHHDAEWASERMLRANHKSETGVKQAHIPDAIITIGGRKLAIEVELTTKTYARLDKILQELAESEYHSIWYFTLDRAKQVVETAINALPERYQGRFVVYDLDETELE